MWPNFFPQRRQETDVRLNTMEKERMVALYGLTEVARVLKSLYAGRVDEVQPHLTDENTRSIIAELERTAAQLRRSLSQ